MADREQERERGQGLVPRDFFRNPFPSLMQELENRMNQLMPGGVGGESGISVSEDDQNVYVEAQLPGIQQDDIDVSLHQNTLWIKGERQQEEKNEKRRFYRRARNSFFYQVELPTQVEENSEQAQFNDGILKITFKKTKQAQMKKISIGRSNKQQQQQQTQQQAKQSTTTNKQGSRK